MLFVVPISYRFRMKQFRGNQHKAFLLHIKDIIN